MNEFKKKLLKILILTAVSAYSIKCFAMKKNSEDIFKNSENNISQISYYDEDSYNSIKTPVNKINIKKINEEEESLFSENNKYLNNKKNSKNIFNNNQNQYSDSDEFSIASINPTNNLNNINNDINKINNENDEFLNKKRKLENEDEKKENISKISNDNKDNHNSEKASSNEINNNIIEINEDNKLNVSDEINDDQRLFMKEYKKYFITYIFKQHIASEVDNVIEEYVKNYNSKNKNFIYLESKRCRIGLNLNLGYKDLKPIKIQIWLPRVIKQKFKGEDFEDFIDNIMSNYKVIIEKARKKTIDSFKNLDMNKTIEIVDNNKFIAGASDIPKWVDFFVFVPKNSKSKFIENVLNDLKNINENKKDPCAKFFSNFETFVHSINIKAADNETQENFKVVKGTNIKGKNLVNPMIKRNGKEIKLKNYTF